MIRVALKMLAGDRARYLGLLMGVSFAALMIAQQGAILAGFITRMYSFITDTSAPDLWVMDKEVEHVADPKSMLEMRLYAVRGIEGVAWAAPMHRSWTQARLPDGSLRGCQLIGIDDATLVGGPPTMVEGSLTDLRRPDAVIVGVHDVSDKLGTRVGGAGGSLKVGDSLELNDHRAHVVGTYQSSPGFFWEPVVYTTYARALQFAPQQRRTLTYILVKAKPGEDLEALRTRIERLTGLAAYTKDGFSRLTVKFIAEKTGILVNFGVAIGISFLVGVLITGQTFYNFTLDNLRHFAALKAMGAGNHRIVGMVVVQALTIGALGYGMGVGGAALTGVLVGSMGNLAFAMPWQLLAFTGLAIALVCIGAAFLSVRRVMVVEPEIVFKGA